MAAAVTVRKRAEMSPMILFDQPQEDPSQYLSFHWPDLQYAGFVGLPVNICFYVIPA